MTSSRKRLFTFYQHNRLVVHGIIDGPCPCHMYRSVWVKENSKLYLKFDNNTVSSEDVLFILCVSRVVQLSE